jgi:hypothetical protein
MRTRLAGGRPCAMRLRFSTAVAVGVPHPCGVCVQSHDILYRLSLDILYTPARVPRAGVVPWHGRPWICRNNEFGLW